MRVAATLLVAFLFSGCFGVGGDSIRDPEDSPSQNGDHDPDAPVEQSVESGHLEAGRHFLEVHIELTYNATVTATFTVESPIEYAVISLQNCGTRAGSGTGFVQGGNATHTESFAPGTVCVTFEVRHDEAFDYVREVSWTPT